MGIDLIFAMELNRNFTVEITRAIPNSETGYNTFVFKCGNSIEKSDKDFGYTGELYRANVRITEVQGAYKDNCSISIYGLSIDKLTELTFMAWNPVQEIDPRNSVKITVDEQTIYQGTTYRVFADFSEAPEVCLRITGVVGIYAAALSKQSRVYLASEKRKVGDVFKELGDEIGVHTIVNKKVKDNLLPDITLKAGSVGSQVETLAKSLNLQYNLDFGYLRVAPKDEILGFSENDTVGDFMNSKDIPVINYTNGLIGYPIFNEKGVTFRAIFDPVLRPGNVIDLESVFPKVSGRYVITSKTSTLSTLPNGQWSAEYICYFLPRGE